MLRLLSLLQSHRDWSGADLAERLEVSPRTVRRDVDRLRMLGYPVDATPGVDGGYRLAAGAALPPLVLDDDEAVALVVALRAAATLAISGAAEASVNALAKVVQVLPARLRQRAENIAKMTVSADWSDTLGHGRPDHVGHTGHRGAQHRTGRVLLPRSGPVVTEDRLVEPAQLVMLGRRWYLVAYDVEPSRLAHVPCRSCHATRAARAPLHTEADSHRRCGRLRPVVDQLGHRDDDRRGRDRVPGGGGAAAVRQLGDRDGDSTPGPAGWRCPSDGFGWPTTMLAVARGGLHRRRHHRSSGITSPTPAHGSRVALARDVRQRHGPVHAARWCAMCGRWKRGAAWRLDPSGVRGRREVGRAGVCGEVAVVVGDHGEFRSRLQVRVGEAVLMVEQCGVG